MNKKTFYLLLMLAIGFSAMAQEPTGEQLSRDKRFFAGLSYSYMTVDMRLSSMSLHSVWYSQDLGTYELTGDEITEINDQFERNSKINALLAEFGWWMVQKPEKGWQLSGRILVGVAQNQSTIDNNFTGDQELSFNSGFSRPCLGLGFNTGYRLTRHWSLWVNPYLIGTMGKSTDIVDNINPDPINFSSTKEHKYKTLLGKINLLAGYQTGPVHIFAGPGFYGIWSWQDYTRIYAEGGPGEEFSEEMTTHIVNRSWLNATIGASWEIIPALTLSANAELGADINFNGGIQINF